jgi:HK97 family phage major capsid protein
MSEENEDLKKIKEQLKDVHSLFKKANDEALTLESVKGHVDPLVKESVDKINEKLESLESQYEAEIAKLKSSQGWKESEQNEINEKEVELYENYFRKGYNGLNREEQDELREVAEKHNQKASFSGNDADGGFTVRPDFSNRILQDVKENSPIRQIADVMTIGTNEFVDYYDESDVGYGWVSELDARGETTSPELDEFRIQVNEMYAMPLATQNLIDDSAINFESYLQGKIVDRFARAEGESFVSGDGSKKPKGFLSYGAGDGFNLVEQLTSASSGVYAFDDLIDITDALLDPYKPNARWVMNKETRSALRKLKDLDDQYLWQPDNQGGIASMLLGYPVTIAVDMPAVASSSLSIAFGDFRRGYKVIDRQGIRVLRDPYTSKGKIKYYVTKRVGGGVQDFQAIKIGKVKA